MDVAGAITQISSQQGNTNKHHKVSVTIEVDVMKSSYDDSHNLCALKLTLGPCMIHQE